MHFCVTPQQRVFVHSFGFVFIIIYFVCFGTSYVFLNFCYVLVFVVVRVHSCVHLYIYEYNVCLKSVFDFLEDEREEMCE